MSRTLPKVDRCQNCGSTAGDNFCPRCGQECREHRVSMRTLLGDLWAEVFTFDSRIFRSLSPLLIKPGELTLEYIRGRRVRYIPPLRLFLFIILLFFFSLAFRVNPLLSERDAPAAPSDSTAWSSLLSSEPEEAAPARPSGFLVRADSNPSVSAEGAYNFLFLVFFAVTLGSSAWLLELSERHPWLLGWVG